MANSNLSAKEQCKTWMNILVMISGSSVLFLQEKNIVAEELNAEQ
jgi:hypothetical protein